MSVPGLDVARHIPVTPQGRGDAPSGVCRRGGSFEDRANDSPRSPELFPNVGFILSRTKRRKGPLSKYAMEEVSAAWQLESGIVFVRSSSR